MIYNITGGLNANLSELSDGSNLILSGAKFIGKSGEVVIGNIPDRGSNAGISLTVTNDAKTVMYGYYPSQFVINVSSESLSAYSNGIPIEILSASNTDVSTSTIRGSNNKFLKEVSGVPSNVRVGFLDSSDSIISSATDMFNPPIGGSNILPGKSLGIKYKAGLNTYTYKVDSTLSYETKPATSNPITFTNSTNLLTTASVTPTDSSKILSEVTYVPTSISFTTSNTIPSGASFVTNSSAIVKGQYGILSIKSGSNSIQQGYFSGTYEPSLQSRNVPSTTFSTGSATSVNITSDSGYVGLSKVNYCPSNIRVRMFNDSDLSSLSNVSSSPITESNTILSGWNAVVGVKDSASVKYSYIKGTHSTSAKSLKNLMKVTHFSSAADSFTTYSPASGSSFSSITNVPVNISLQFYTDAALSSLTCASKTKLWTSSYLKSGQNLVARIRYGNTDSTDLYVYYVEGSGS